MFYISIDGDRIGETIERLVLEENVDAVQRFSQAVSVAVKQMKEYLEGDGCQIIFAAGDGILALSNKDIDCRTLPLDYDGISFSVGISTSPREALLALKIAKGLGRNQVIRR